MGVWTESREKGTEEGKAELPYDGGITVRWGIPDGALVPGSQNILWEGNRDSTLLTAFGNRHVGSLHENFNFHSKHICVDVRAPWLYLESTGPNRSGADRIFILSLPSAVSQAQPFSKGVSPISRLHLEPVTCQDKSYF